jgi:hypothetical protein
VIESPDTDQASVVFLGRKSFRMQVVGAPAAATGAGAIPVGTWDTPTERIFERRRSPPAAWPPPASPPSQALGKTTVVGIALITFASGVLVATAVDRLRPHLPSRTVHADVGQPAPAPAATAVPAAAVVAKDDRVEKPVAAAATTPAPAAAPAPLAAGGPIVQQLPPPPPEPLPALAAPVAAAAATRPAQAKAKARPVPALTPVATKTPNTAVEPPPFAPSKEASPAAKTPAAKAEPAKPGITPPTPGKWVDPFAD